MSILQKCKCTVMWAMDKHFANQTSVPFQVTNLNATEH